MSERAHGSSRSSRFSMAMVLGTTTSNKATGNNTYLVQVGQSSRSNMTKLGRLGR